MTGFAFQGEPWNLDGCGIEEFVAGRRVISFRIASKYQERRDVVSRRQSDVRTITARKDTHF
jgi:hypothetical protein